MVDIASKLSAKVVEKAVSEFGKQEQRFSPVGGEESPFKQMLNSADVGQDMARDMGMMDTNLGFPGSGVNAISASDIPFDGANVNTGLNGPNSMDKVVSLLSEVNNGQMQTESLVNDIMFSGKKFTNQELLAIQAHVFHVAQVTELVIKAADQGVSSLKTVLNTNIQ